MNADYLHEVRPCFTPKPMSQKFETQVLSTFHGVRHIAAEILGLSWGYLALFVEPASAVANLAAFLPFSADFRFPASEVGPVLKPP